MNSAQIDYALRNDACTQGLFAAVVPSDHLRPLIKQLRLPCAYVVNTDPSTQPGQHWVAFYFPPQAWEPAEFYDTYGQEAGSINGDLAHFLHKYKHRPPPRQNGQVVQGLLSSACGQHCIYFLALRSRGWTMAEILDLFSRQELDWNDSMVTAFVNRHFALDTVVMDWPYVLQTSVSKAT